MNTNIEWRLIVLGKLVFFWVLTGFCEIITKGAPNRRSDDKQEKQVKKDYFEASDSVFQIGNVLGTNRV